MKKEWQLLSCNNACHDQVRKSEVFNIDVLNVAFIGKCLNDN